MVNEGMREGMLILIKIPHDNEKTATAFEQLLDTLHGVLGGKRYLWR